MMGKIEISNEIVLMRQHVRKARVRVVNRLTKEIKKLRTKNGTEKQQDKYKRKELRLVHEIFALKKIKDDEISKFGINNAKDLNAILMNQSLEPKDRIIAKVANVESLRQLVTNFKEKFPHYRNCLNSKGKRFNETSDEEDDNEESKPNIVQECKKPKEKIDEIVSSSSKPEPDVIPNSDDGDLNIKKPNLNKIKKTDKTIKPNTCQESNINDTTTSKILKINSKEAVVERFNQLLETDHLKNVDVACNEDTIVPKQDEPELQVDDFFTYADGNKYLRLVTDSDRRFNDNSQNVNEDENLQDEYPCKNFKYNKEYNSFDNFKQKQRGIGFDHSHKKHHNNSIGKTFPIKNQHKNETTNGNESSQPAVDGNSLHPSWMAKKKQQDLLKQGFQGKKIVFDD